MRLFVAIEIDDDTRRQLARAREAIQRVISRARVPPRVTWVRDEVAHITVRFIGETADETVSRVQHALEALRLQSFEVTWGTVGAFGGSRNPRVLWLGPTVVSAAFQELDRLVNACLDPVIGPEPPRTFTPHVTLGRVKVPGKGVDWATALAGASLTPTVTRVDHVTLYQSRLSPNGPTYTALSTHG